MSDKNQVFCVIFGGIIFVSIFAFGLHYFTDVKPHNIRKDKIYEYLGNKDLKVEKIPASVYFYRVLKNNKVRYFYLDKLGRVIELIEKKKTIKEKGN